jgi:putative transposase
MLSYGIGYVEGVTHTYKRHGAATLLAALDIASGKVITTSKHRHRHQKYLAFLKHVDQNAPKNFDIHLVVDNNATHQHAKVKRWLALHPCYHVHYTPTYASWLNQVEIWFNLITQKAIRRGTFKSVKELIAKIDNYVKQYNISPRQDTRCSTTKHVQTGS